MSKELFCFYLLFVLRKNEESNLKKSIWRQNTMEIGSRLFQNSCLRKYFALKFVKFWSLLHWVRVFMISHKSNMKIFSHFRNLYVYHSPTYSHVDIWCTERIVENESNKGLIGICKQFCDIFAKRVNDSIFFCILV